MAKVLQSERAQCVACSLSANPGWSHLPSSPLLSFWGVTGQGFPCCGTYEVTFGFYWGIVGGPDSPSGTAGEDFPKMSPGEGWEPPARLLDVVGSNVCLKMYLFERQSIEREGRIREGERKREIFLHPLVCSPVAVQLGLGQAETQSQRSFCICQVGSGSRGLGPSSSALLGTVLWS